MINFVGQWSKVVLASGTLPPIWLHSSCFDAKNNKIYITGGGNSTAYSSFYIYNIVSKSIAIVSSPITYFPNFNVENHSSEFVNGLVYIICGYIKGAYLSTIYTYNPVQGMKKKYCLFIF